MLLIKEALFFLYEKRGIKFFPQRPGLPLGTDEFVIPGFAKVTRKIWYLSHYVVAFTDASWVLNEMERNLTQKMDLIQKRSRTQAIGWGVSAPDVRPQDTRGVPQGMRQELREAGAGRKTTPGRHIAPYRDTVRASSPSALATSISSSASEKGKSFVTISTSGLCLSGSVFGDSWTTRQVGDSWTKASQLDLSRLSTPSAQAGRSGLRKMQRVAVPSLSHTQRQRFRSAHKVL